MLLQLLVLPQSVLLGNPLDAAVVGIAAVLQRSPLLLDGFLTRLGDVACLEPAVELLGGNLHQIIISQADVLPHVDSFLILGLE